MTRTTDGQLVSIYNVSSTRCLQDYLSGDDAYGNNITHIYMITCKCKAFYIGMTTRDIETRLEEHIETAQRRGKDKVDSKLYEHMRKCGAYSCDIKTLETFRYINIGHILLKENA